jgi:hypothetical protein
MPKTGSSSIQDTLFYNLTDPRFHYTQLTGHANAAHFIQAIFKETPQNHWIYRRKGWPAEKIEEKKKDYITKLQKQLMYAARTGKISILSAETIWQFKSNELESLKAFFEELELTVKIVLYLRPIKSWIESSFQENVKYGIGFTDLSCLSDGTLIQQLDYKKRLSFFESIFGKENLVLRCFNRNSLHKGCVVADFCRYAGIDLNPHLILRANDSIGADAVRLLHSYNHFARDRDPPSLAMNHMLVMHLEELVSEPFRLHSKMIAPLQDLITTQNQAILQQYEIDIYEDLCHYDNGYCIESTADLQEFSRNCLDWLAHAACCTAILQTEGEASAREVANQVAALVYRPTMAIRRRWFRQTLRSKLHGLSQRLAVATQNALMAVH